MDKLVIHGGHRLEGEVQISGAKNAALPLMAASLLTEEGLTLTHMPYLADITAMANLLGHLGVELGVEGAYAQSGTHNLSLKAAAITTQEAPYDLVRKMRASILVLGPLLARFGVARVSLPGGCAIGARPVDLHLKAMEALGAKITLDEGYVIAEAPEGGLKGGEVNFPKVSVGATENILMAAVLADGVTLIRNAAREPEITDLAECLVAMGANIDGIGSDRLEVTGVPSLHKATHRVVADRIEAGSFAIAAAMTGGDITLKDVQPRLLRAVLASMQEAGITIEEAENSIRVKSNGDIKAVDIETQPFPAFPTDMQAQWVALMTQAEGSAIVNETIFENRFMHVPELQRMGANIRLDGHMAVVTGKSALKGAPVMATDLRASMALVLAGLVAEGETTVSRIYHLDRGYERLEDKLAVLGADIRRERE